jgi:hypothetical protein
MITNAKVEIVLQSINCPLKGCDGEMLSTMKAPLEIVYDIPGFNPYFDRYEHKCGACGHVQKFEGGNFPRLAYVTI